LCIFKLPRGTKYLSGNCSKKMGMRFSPLPVVLSEEASADRNTDVMIVDGLGFIKG
jgi:hypothetical protein